MPQLTLLVLLSLIHCVRFFLPFSSCQNFSNQSIASETPSVQHNAAFTVDMETAQTDSVTIEPLPDIASKSETMTSSRPKIKCVGRGSQAAFLSMSGSLHRSIEFNIYPLQNLVAEKKIEKFWYPLKYIVESWYNVPMIQYTFSY